MNCPNILASDIGGIREALCDYEHVWFIDNKNIVNSVYDNLIDITEKNNKIAGNVKSILNRFHYVNIWDELKF